MRNASDKSCKEGQNKHYMFNTFFPKKLFMRKCWKLWKDQTGHRWQYGARAVHAG